MFLVNVPVAVAAAVVAPIVLRDARGRVSRPLDVAGAVTSTLTLVGLVFGLARAAEAGLGDAISVVALTAALGLGFAFVVAERRALDPLVPLRLLRLPSLLGTDLTAFAVSTLIAATPFLLTLYGQRVLGLTPVMTGLAFLPMTAAITATATIAARRAHRIGVRRLLLLGIGTLFVAALMLSRMPVDGRYLTDVLPGMLLFAVGLGASYTAAAIGGTAGVPDGDQGVAGGLLDTSKQVGGAIGLAVLAAVATGGGGLASQTDAALVEGVSNAFITALAFTAVAVVPVTSLVRRPSGHEKPSRLRQGAGQRLDTQTARKAPADGVSPVHGRPAGLEPLPAPC